MTVVRQVDEHDVQILKESEVRNRIHPIAALMAAIVVAGSAPGGRSTKIPWTRAPSRAADAPVPATSPTTTPKRPSRSRYSKKSPPMERHGTMSAAVET